MKQVIELLQPKLFIAENVKGPTSLGDVLPIIRKDFASAADGGYLVVPPRILNAANYGMPQACGRIISDPGATHSVQKWPCPSAQSPARANALPDL